MKILQVRFQNLNSLAGEWEIDLTHPAFVSDGIFAITGPTGSGKTTILDAICLALYGRTPRLARVTQGGNEIMSRQTGECFAEVTFETQAGRFCSNWSQRRARKKADGAFQAPKHEISDVGTGKILATKIKEVGEMIESVTGMDFEGFTRSMMLAQGDFAKFLQAAPDERSPILEQITGTGIYSDISIRVHELWGREKSKLNALQSETAGILILTPEQLSETQLELATFQTKNTHLTQELTHINNAITWLTQIDGMSKELTSLHEELVKWQNSAVEFKPERARLELAIKAALLDGLYASLAAMRRQQADESVALKTEESALPNLASLANAQAQVLQTAERQTVKANEAVGLAAPTIQEVRLLDQKLIEMDKAIAEGGRICESDKAKIDADSQTQLNVRATRTKAENDLSNADSYLKEHAVDHWLVGGLAGIEEQLGALLHKHGEIVHRDAEIIKADAALVQAVDVLGTRTKEKETQKQELADVLKTIDDAGLALGEILFGHPLSFYRDKKDALLREQTLLARIAELEDHRAKLEDGKPCPLCGSEEHPYAEGNIPALDENEKKIETLTATITEAEKMDALIKEQKEQEAVARKNLSESKSMETIAINDKKIAKNTLAQLRAGVQELRAGFAELKQAVSIKLQPLGITEIPDNGVPTLLQSLSDRLSTWQSWVNRKAETEKQISGIDNEISRLGAIITTQQTALNDKQGLLATLKNDRADTGRRRGELYGDKNPEDEVQRLNKAAADAHEHEKNSRTQHSSAQQALIASKTRIDALKERISDRAPELAKLEQEFATTIESAEFTNEAQFLSARLTNEQRGELISTSKAIDEGLATIKARRKDREEGLAAEKSKKITEKSIEELRTRLQELEDSQKEVQGTIASLNHKLKENTRIKEQIKTKEAAIEAQKKEFLRWDNLHTLIGSSDGKKYRNFAQGLSFDIMVGRANQQLQKMTDRYLLVRDKEKPLNLNVIDSYQAGEIRSTANLSGGEGFIVSMALALGLSHMASKNVKVDSLFLDEGFGTLDEDALDTALETLTALQQDGKLIGVISHVPALKERISVQIEVTPQIGGRSHLSGKGCRHIAP